MRPFGMATQRGVATGSSLNPLRAIGGGSLPAFWAIRNRMFSTQGLFTRGLNGVRGTSVNFHTSVASSGLL